MTDKFHSIKEAAEFAGVSKKTIERAYKKHIDDPKLGKLIKKVPHGSGYRYFVTTEFVEKCVLGTPEAKNRVNRTGEPSDALAMVTFREQLQTKDRRIDELLEMLREKDQFAEALIRKGLQLPSGERSSVDPADVDRDATSVNTNDESTTSESFTPVVDAEIVTREEGITTAQPILFPTFGKVRTLLGTDIGHFFGSKINKRN